MTWCVLAVSVLRERATHSFEPTHIAPSSMLAAPFQPTVLELAMRVGRPGQLGSGVTELTGSLTRTELEGGRDDSNGDAPISRSI
jgi:hypothetical protein